MGLDGLHPSRRAPHWCAPELRSALSNNRRTEIMALYPILRRWSTSPIVLVEGATFARALELAVDRQVKLHYADLREIVAPRASLAKAELGGADLTNAILSGVNLEAADLRTAKLERTFLQEAVLRNADLRGADLRGADLRVANLQETQLTGADLRGALLYGSRLRGAILDWRWSAIPLELLRQGLDKNDQTWDVPIDPAAARQERPFAWLKSLLSQGPKEERVLRVLSPHIHEGDNAPPLLRKLAADVVPAGNTVQRAAEIGLCVGAETRAQSTASSAMLWTRRRSATERLLVCRPN
jgi:hypothetical protein